MYVEKYYPLLARDIEDATDALTESLPDAVRAGLESELKKLSALNAVLSGDADKSTVHQLRAKLRWARQRLSAEKDTSKKKKIEAEVSAIEADIRKEVERKGRK
jgi:hypothetical protein